MGHLKDHGFAWQRVAELLGLKFSGFVDRRPMDLVVASFFCKILLRFTHI